MIVNMAPLLHAMGNRISHNLGTFVAGELTREDSRQMFGRRMIVFVFLLTDVYVGAFLNSNR